MDQVSSARTGRGLRERLVARMTVGFEFATTFSRDVLHPGNPSLAEAVAGRDPAGRHSLLAVVDGGLAARNGAVVDRLSAYATAHGLRLALAAPPLVVPGGEAAKTDPAVVTGILERIAGAGLDRHGVVLAVGGGAVLDAASHAAALAQRGVRLVRLPSTVFAQADAALSVHHGVNAFGRKDFLGGFAPPDAVVVDLDLLSDLSPRDIAGGLAAAVTAAVLRDDTFFHRLCRDSGALARAEMWAVEPVVVRTARLTLEQIVGSGTFDSPPRRPAVLGRWGGHKLESLSGYTLRHGEAVAIGTALDCAYATAVGLLARDSCEAVCGLMERIGLRLWHESLDGRDGTGRRRLLEGLDEYRQQCGGELSIALPCAIGRAVEVHAIDGGLIDQCVEWLRMRDRQRTAAA